MDVAVVFGSESDMVLSEDIKEVFGIFGIEYEMYVISAHRAPKKLVELVSELEKKRTKVIISAAGLAAHLPGVISSLTSIPVIGIPVGKSLGGMDSLLSIAQMPKGVPVATVGIDNSYNAALMAVKIISVHNEGLRVKLDDYRENRENSYSIYPIC